MGAVPAEDVAWFAIEHESAVGTVRRAAMGWAERLGFSPARAGEVGIVTSELAGNQVKHAQGGTMLLRACRGQDEAGLEVIAIDSGPGMADLTAAFTDGQSTAGTLGIGLGAVARLATSWDGFSRPGRGTVLRASFGPDGMARTGRGLLLGGITRPTRGETECGDAYGVRIDGEYVSALLVDGLGHGPLAATAARTAIRAFESAPPGGPAALLAHVHRQLSGTRGAAAAVLQCALPEASPPGVTGGRPGPDSGELGSISDRPGPRNGTLEPVSRGLPSARGIRTGGGPRARQGRSLHYAGIGNISGWILDGQQRTGLLSYPGIAGSRAQTIRELSYEWPQHAVVVLHSDGLTSRLNPDGGSGLLTRSPVVIAATLLRDYGTRADDASVLVLAPEPGS